MHAGCGRKPFEVFAPFCNVERTEIHSVEVYKFYVYLTSNIFKKYISPAVIEVGHTVIVQDCGYPTYFTQNIILIIKFLLKQLAVNMGTSAFEAYKITFVKKQCRPYIHICNRKRGPYPNLQKL